MRSPTRPKPRLARNASFPAPNGGWIANQNLAAPDRDGPPGAAMLENWFPTATGARMRAGSMLYATVGAGAAVGALFSYTNGNNRKFFTANTTAIYDITSPASATVSPAAAVSGQTSGAWIFAQIANAGGTYIRGVNGANTPQLFDGTTWTTTPAITGTGLSPNNLSYVWKFKQRLYFVEKDTLTAWYLDLDAIGGTATRFPLGGVFSRGGSLLFGETWSMEAGDGLADRCVFVTTEGEVAVYEGLNPSDWSLVGVYRIGKPRGPKAWMRAGGDLVIATDIGFIPLSQAVQRDIAALGLSAVSYPIETAWNAAVAARGTGTWACESWPTKQMVLIALSPDPGGAVAQMLVVNVRTGAWALYTGWDGTCLQTFGDRLFYGTSDGKVIEAEVGGDDQGATYTANLVPLFQDMRSPASLKVVQLARAVYLAPAQIVDRVTIQTDYSIDLPAAPDESPFVVTGLWGSGVWGTSIWGKGVVKKTFQQWRSVYGAGSAIAPALQVTSGSTAPPDVEFVRFDITYDVADIVT